MLRSFILVLITLVPLLSFAQKRYDAKLKKQLDSIMLEDQRYRQYMDALPRTKAAFDSIWALQTPLDSMDLIFVEKVLKKSGYPGKSMVGTPTNNVAWYVIQHSPKIKEYFPVMQRAGKQGELPQALVAMMEDRLLTEDGKEQIYDTQSTGIPAFDAMCRQIGEKGFVIWPIKDADHVNERRKKAGFKETVEENAKDMGIEYRKITMKQLDSMQSCFRMHK
jgi:hypothetical protein